MADEGEDLELVIEPEEDKPNGDVVVNGDKVEAAPKIVTADEGIEALKAKLATSESEKEQERNGRLEAERRANDATRTAHEARVEVQDSNLALVTNAIDAVKARQAALKAQYREARASGDVDAEADVMTEMQAAAAQLVQLETGKVAMEKAPKPEEPKPTVQSDPVEALAAQLSARSAAWVRAHPEYARDNRKYAQMLAAHNLAVERDGASIDTDDYFTSIEETLKIRAPVADPADEPLSEAAAPVQRRASPAAAPVTRSGTGDGSRPNRVTLTPAEVEIAEMMGMSNNEYGKHKLALIKEGKLH